MAETTAATSTAKTPGRRKTLIGEVVSTKMAKTIVVEVRRQKAHPFYKRVVARSKKFYAHDEDGTAHLGDFAAEAERLVREKYLSADERAVLDLDALAAFWNSELGGKIRLHAAEVRRELPFTARFSPAEIRSEEHNTEIQ